MSRSSNASGRSVRPQEDSRVPPWSRSAFSEPGSTTPKESESALLEPGRLKQRLHALNLAIAGLESEFARLLDVFNSLPAWILKDDQIDREDINLCRREFMAGSSFLQVISGNVRAIEAYRLRLQASKIQTLLVQQRYVDAADTLASAEQDISAHHLRLANLGLAIANVSVTAQHIRQTAHLRKLQDTVFNLEQIFAKLKARYRTLLVNYYTPSQSEVELYDTVILEETFGEGPLKRSEIEAEMIRLHALVRKAETAIDLYWTKEAEDRLLDSSKIVETVNAHLTELAKLLGRHEQRKAWMSWLEFCRQRSHKQPKSNSMEENGRREERPREDEREEDGDESGENCSWHSCLEDQERGSDPSSSSGDTVAAEVSRKTI